MTDTQPRVSIGLPVFNGERYLAETLDSILSQSFSDFELIISDNASTDNTEETCREYRTMDRRIVYNRSKKNLGASWNYNRVFELSRGQYFKWAAHDDKCAPDFLRRCVQELDERPEIVLCYPKTTLIDENGSFVAMDEDNLCLDSTDMLTRFTTCLRPMKLCHNVVFGLMRRSTLAKTRLIGTYVAADRCLLAELSLYGGFREIPEYLFYRRMRPGNIGNAPEDMGFYDPARMDKLVLPEWRVIWEHLNSIRRAPLKLKQKFRLRSAVLKSAVSNYSGLEWELKVLIKRLLGLNPS
jgi:glycosyltransferase involved in cell wall biosynthesis